MIDIPSVAAAALPHLESICHELLPGGKTKSGRYHCDNLNGGKGESFCVWLHNGAWKDFADDTVKGGDAVSLVAAVRCVNQLEAAQWLAERYGQTAGPVKPKPTKPATLALPAPDPLPPLPTSLSGFPVSRHWLYQNAIGQVVGIVLRAEIPNDKIVRPFIWSGKAWVSGGMPTPRPLYRLPELLANPKSPVLMVEGEPAAVAALEMLAGTSWQVTTWAQGSASFHQTDSTPLADRTVVFWPDRDEPGRKCAEAVKAALPHAKVVTPPEGADDGWDLADAHTEGWQGEDVLPFLDDALAQADAEPEQTVVDATPEKPFQCLGFMGHKFYVLPANGGQVLAFTAPELTEANLITVASMDYWLETYGETKETAKGEVTVIRWSRARCDIVEECRKVGVFDFERIRGVGCWLEGKRVIVHTGDHLICDGKPAPLTASTNFIYHRERTIHEQADIEPLSDAAAARLINLSKLANWTHPMSHLYFAGWCYIAPICGALHWRPHIWIMGKPGIGKSWITNNILQNCLGKFSVGFRGGSTGPGIRQGIGRNALPSVGDDIESDVGASTAVQAILAFARNCSSPGEAKVLKGTSDQSGVAFAACSMFACNSVNSPAMEQADKTRWSLLELIKNTAERFESMKAIAAETVLDPAWCAGLRVRARRDAAVLAANAKVFSKAIAAKVGDSRAGDQLGTLLAGAYGLAKSGPVSDATARDWVASQDWEGSTVDPDESPEQACLLRLLDAKVRVETEPACERTVAECVQAMRGIGAKLGDLTKEAIERNGIRWSDGVLSVSVAHPFLSKIYQGTRWESGTWGQDLIRLPGPDGNRKQAVRVGGVSRKCVLLAYE